MKYRLEALSPQTFKILLNYPGGDLNEVLRKSRGFELSEDYFLVFAIRGAAIHTDFLILQGFYD